MANATLTVAGPRTEPSPRRGAVARRGTRSGLLFVLPALATMAALIVYPLAYGMFISFFSTNLINRWRLVGLDNYVSALQNSAFVQSLGTTAIYAGGTVGGTLVVGMIFALLLNQEFPGRTFFRVVLIIPWVLPEVVVALLWRWMYNPLYGILSYATGTIGIGSEWLENPSTAMVGIIIASIWKGFPLVMVLLLAGLQSIGKELYEAAALDGANQVKSFVYVTLPSLAPVLLITLILETVWWFKHFTMVWLLTAGGPVDATKVVSISIYQTAFENFQWGRSAAMAVIVFIICLLASIIYRRVIRDER
jgi:multiple sugar transport system permease protein